MFLSLSIAKQFKRQARKMKVANIILSNLTFFKTVQLQNVVRVFNEA